MPEEPTHAGAAARSLVRGLSPQAIANAEQREALRAADQRRERDRIESEAEHHRAMGRADWLRGCGVPVVFSGAPLREDLVPAQIRAWAARFPDALREPGGAILCGDVGAGKSAAASWLVREVWNHGRAREGHNQRGRWIVPECFFLDAGDLYRAVFRQNDALLDQARTAALLVVDDVGIAYEGSEWGPAELDGIINHRHHASRPTVVTTNLVPGAGGLPAEQTFEGRYRRAYSRLCHYSGPGVVKVLRPDLRREPAI